MRSDFLDGRTLDRLIGTTRQIHGIRYTINALVSERHQPRFNERWVVLEAASQQNNDRLIVKMRFQCNPCLVESAVYRTAAVTWGMGSFDAECLALRECEGSGGTPKLLAQARLIQDNYDIYPGGYVSVIVMSRVAGQRIVEFLPDLIDDEKRTIRADLIQILEYMRLKNWNFAEPQPDQIFYDRATGKTSLVGLSRSGRNSEEPDPRTPITADSIDVTAFCLEFLCM
ncbi:hypothetical protein BJX68DRAFT_266638 [Aspergillus pseudodeflectus]|uniref:Protein kinase domain-containing protein n=1 Tax=Aspergillus pseudodeflectus TaxID=176178 RepID=A0ABR4KDT0_9EURO